MHRSGTSAITKVLSLCGASLPDHLMPASDSNPRGYFESQRIYKLHEALLAEAGTSWDDVSPFPADWLRSTAAPHWIERLAEAVEEEFGRTPFVILKDPRMCRIVPLWRKVLERLDLEAVFVLAVRNPLDVAASLKRAQATDESKAMLLWLQHFLAAERDTRGARRTFLEYEALLTDWRRCLARISEDLGLVLPRLGRRASAEVDAFLEHELQHHATRSRDLVARHDVAGWVKSAYGWAQRAAAGEDVDPSILDEIEGELRPAERVFGPLLASLELSRARSGEEVERLGRRGAHLEEQLGELRSELAAERSQVAAHNDQLTRLREQLSLRERQMGQLIEWVKVLLQWSTHVIHGGQASSAHLESILPAIDAADPGAVPQIATTGIRLVQQSAEAVRLAEEVDLRTAEAERLREELRAARSELEAKQEKASRERQAEVERLNQQVRGLWQRISSRDREFAELRQASDSAAAEADRVRRQTAQLEAQLQSECATIADLQRQLRAYSGAVAERDLYIRELSSKLAQIQSSRSWKAARPLRRLEEGVGALLKR